MLENIKAVIFDMDGVIFDSEKIYYDAFVITAEKYNLEYDDDFIISMSGKTMPVCQLMVQNMLNNDIAKTESFFYDWGRERLDILNNQGLGFKKGFEDLFTYLKQTGCSIGLVTSAPLYDVKENFARNNSSLLNDFNHIITVEDVEYPKPHPQPYQMMMKHFGLDAKQCIVVEDSITGVSAAVAAGANTIMINGFVEPSTDLADKIVAYVKNHTETLQFIQQQNCL